MAGFSTATYGSQWTATASSRTKLGGRDLGFSARARRVHSMARRLGRRALVERAQPPLPHLGEVHVVAMHLRSGAREGLEAVLTRRCRRC